jgi:hypothetical protein
MVQQLTENAGFSLAEMMATTLDNNGIPYIGAVNRFASHATAHSIHLDYEALVEYSAKERDRDRSTKLFFFIDVFSINQSNVGSDGELPELENAIREAGTTVLIFDTWHDPEVIRRIWCLFEIQKTLVHSCKLDVCFSTAERGRLIRAVRDDGDCGDNDGGGGEEPRAETKHQLRNKRPGTSSYVLTAVSQIDAAKAEATRPEDVKRIGKEISATVQVVISGGDQRAER